MKKVLFITPSYFPNVGGVEKHVYEIARRLSEKLKITVLTICEDDKLKSIEEIDNIQIKRIRIKKVRFLNILKLPFYSVKNIFSICRHDVVHVHDWLLFYYLVLPILPLLWICRVRVHITFHGWEGDFPPKRKVILLRNFADNITRKSIIVGEFIYKWYQMNTKPIIIYGASDVKHKKITHEKPNNLFLFVGRLAKDSGIEFAIEHFNKIADIPSKKLIVLGDGVLKKDLIKSSDIKNSNIEFKGFVKNVDDYLKQAKFVYTSGYLGILEALARGSYVISSFNHELKKDYLFGIKSIFQQNLLILDERDNGDTFYFNDVIIDNDEILRAQKLNWEKISDTYLKLWNYENFNYRT